jgi:ATP-dependent RNA helicase DDX24/MAK5
MALYGPPIQLYVHRSGRTARAQREGLSVMLVGPEDVKAYRNICKSLNKGSTIIPKKTVC